METIEARPIVGAIAFVTLAPNAGKMNFLKISIALIGVSLLASCSKEPGKGGNASIRGKVRLEARILLNNPATAVYTAPAADWDVYIVYGDGPGPDDRIRSNYDGEFEFNYLREGDYTVYVYSNDTSATAVNLQSPDKVAFRQSVTIGDRKEEITLRDFTVYIDNE